MTTAQVIFLLCGMIEATCSLQPGGRVTEYSPELGGINCQEPCNITASGMLIDYGVTIACGPDIPFGTYAYIEGVGWRVCQDRGGMIDNDEVDVLVYKEEYLMGISGYRDFVFVFGE